jgi:hypothetical protein
MPGPKATVNTSSQNKQPLKPQKNLFSFFCKVDEKKNETKVGSSPVEAVVLKKDSFSSQSPTKSTMEVTPSSSASTKFEHVSFFVDKLFCLNFYSGEAGCKKYRARRCIGGL